MPSSDFCVNIDFDALRVVRAPSARHRDRDCRYARGQPFVCRRDHFRDFAHFQILLIRELLQTPKCLLLGEPGPLHEDALGLLDELAGLQRLLEVLRLLLQRLELEEPPHDETDRGLQIVLLDRLNEISQDMLAQGRFNVFRIMIGRYDNHWNHPVSSDLFDCFEAVELRHLDIGNDEIGKRFLAPPDKLRAGRGFHDNFVAELLERDLKELEHSGLVVRHGNTKPSSHLPLSEVR